MMLQFIKTGLFDTLQDGGRYGFRKFGIPVSGFMDEISAQMANELVGNDINAALFEFTLKGPELIFHEECMIALTGADMQAMLNGKLIDRYVSVLVKPNDVLVLKQALSGCRVYLAVGGEINAPAYFGSKSTYSYASLGTVIKSGDTFQVDKKKPFVLKKEEIPFYPSSVTLRVMPGPEHERIDGNQLKVLQEEAYQLSTDSNRMGCRLKGEPIKLNNKDQILSSPILKGTVQIPQSGMPLIFMSDAPTSGGYPRIVQVLRRDLVQLAQLQPGGFVRFKLVDIEL